MSDVVLSICEVNQVALVISATNTSWDYVMLFAVAVFFADRMLTPLLH